MTLTALLASAAAAFAPGDAVTSAIQADVADITRVVDALDVAVDQKDWSAARALFVDTVAVDFTSLAGGEPATIPSDALIAGWSGNLTANKTSFHMRTNHRITFDGPNAARVHSQGYAWNRLEAGALPEHGGEALWEVWGGYVHGLERTPEGWRINAMSLHVATERGNAYVRDTPGD